MTSDTTLDAHIELQKWVIRHGGYFHDSLQLARNESRGVHIQVKPGSPSSIPEATCLIKIPMALTMSYFDAIDFCPLLAIDGIESPFSSHGVTFPRSFIDAVGPVQTTTFFLMGQFLRGSDGFWHPYIRTLPQAYELTTPLYFDKEDVAWLNGTCLYGAREQRLKARRSSYESSLSKLKESGMGDLDGYTWDLYLWASTIISSRAFSGIVLSGVVASELIDDKISVFIPLMDVTNHQPLAKVEWQPEKEYVAFVAMEDVLAGHEIINNYGPRNNEQLMMNYGFCIPANPCEYRIVGLKPPPGSLLETAKAAQKEAFSLPGEEIEDRYYVFNLVYPLLDPEDPLEHSIFSPELFGAVSVLAANAREQEALRISRSLIRILDRHFGDSRNQLAALSLVLVELITHAIKLKFSGRELTKPLNSKRVYAKIFRESHIMVSQTAVVVAHWTLTRATEWRTPIRSRYERENRVNAYLTKIPPGIFPAAVINQLRSVILSRRSLIENDGELFQLCDLLGTLPNEMQEPSTHSLHTILKRARHLFSASNADEPPTTLSFSVFLSFLVGAHRDASNTSSSPSPKYPLSPRLRKWISFLLDTYKSPLEDNDSSWKLADEEDEDFLNDFDTVVLALRIHNPELFSDVTDLVGRPPSNTNDDERDWWLSPNWLRWAWFVVDNETINVPNNPLECLLEEHLGSSGVVTLSTTSYLYIPQNEQE